MTTVAMKQSTLAGLFSPKCGLQPQTKPPSDSETAHNEHTQEKTQDTEKQCSSESENTKLKKDQPKSKKVKSKLSLSSEAPNSQKKKQQKRKEVAEFEETGANTNISRKSKPIIENSKAVTESSTLKVKEEESDVKASDEKETLSYEDFLGMFKPANLGEPVNTENEEVPENIKDEPESSVPEPVKGMVQCRTITSFFKKSSVKTIDSKSEVKSSAQTVTVDVHRDALSKIQQKQDTSLATSINKKCEKTLKKNESKGSQHDDNEIILLSSEIIVTDDKDDIGHDMSAQKVGNKRKCDNTARTEGSEIKKVKFDESGKKGTSKEETQGMVVDVEAPVTVNDTTQENASVPSASSTKNPSLTRTQSKLSFGKSGLSVVKPVLNVEEDESKVNEKLSDRIEVSVQSPPKTVEETMDVGVGTSDAALTSTETEKGKKKGPSGTRNLRSRDTNVHETQNTEDSPTQPTTSLRRSSRTTRPIQSFKEVEVMEVDVDDDEDEKKINEKRCKELKRPPKSEMKTKSPLPREPEKKVPGKLAPIFTKVKAAEEEAPIPVEDPEKARLKREFLMSGVPEELKRLIASNTLSNVSGDYPPFPKHNHTQQLDGQTVHKSLVQLKVKIRGSDGQVSPGDYVESKNWSRMAFSRELDYQDAALVPFKNFSAHPILPKEFVNVVLADFQNSDGKFPFKETYQYLQSQLTLGGMSGAELSKKCPAETLEDSVIVVDDEGPQAETSEELARSQLYKNCLWSDLHFPNNSKHLIGNAKAIQHMKEWLVEWKLLMEKEASREKKGKKKGRSLTKEKSESKESDWSDDSDFIDSDEEEEDLSLCNTIVITGPHGVGKTSSVYALAQEMGFKVFEVNASSLRSGKQLLSQLEEATQSHRVSRSKMATLQTPTSISQLGKQEVENSEAKSSKKGKKTPQSSSKPAGVNSAFANFFRPVQKDKAQDTPKTTRGRDAKGKSDRVSSRQAEGTAVETESAKKNTKNSRQKAKRLKRNEDEDVEVVEMPEAESATASSGSLNLTSSSLILFDEVDIIFEDDRGFLATVQHFMTSTKIPIVLTARDVSFHHQLSARHEHLVFKRPPQRTIASLLCTVCLSHGVRVSHRSMLNLASLTKGDIRRALLQLHFWCESGGGTSQIILDLIGSPQKESHKPSSGKISPKSLGGNVVSKEEQAPVKDDDENVSDVKPVFQRDSSDDDFTCLKFERKRRGRMVLDDNASTSSNVSVASSQESSTAKCKRRKQQKQRKSKRDRRGGKTADEKTGRRAKHAKDDSACGGGGDDGMNTSLEQTVFPPVHLGCEEGVLAMRNSVASSTAIINLIKAPLVDLEPAVHVCGTLKSLLESSAVYRLALHSLPLPRADSLLIQLTLPHTSAQTASDSPAKNAWKRIVVGNWLDSDSSSDGCGKDVSKPAEEASAKDAADEEPSSQVEKTSDDKSSKSEGNVDGAAKSEGNVDDAAKSEGNIDSAERQEHLLSGDGESKVLVKEGRLVWTTLRDLAQYYDCVSTTDVLEASCPGVCGGQEDLAPGMDDTEVRPSGSSHCSQDRWCPEFVDSMHLLSARRLCSQVERRLAEYHGNGSVGDSATDATGDDGQSEERSLSALSGQLDLPIGEKLPDVWDAVGAAELSKNKNALVRNVCDNLGSWHRDCDLAIHMDYLPALREMSRVERERQDTNTKRRFYHYFDSISFGLKPQTVVELASTYTVVDNSFCQ
ncbi:uncharacterized protein LOC101848052 [Aplysia californica]|uniref:Uncharacterized protein LOC101848052 n=1 Tax=Aplysia californica TaxID=6500 RepID=A0ABM0JUK8_APLCA|nr:uncharacterized protein LOC101848052 [Aplysia californica]